MQVSRIEVRNKSIERFLFLGILSLFFVIVNYASADTELYSYTPQTGAGTGAVTLTGVDGALANGFRWQATATGTLNKMRAIFTKQTSVDFDTQISIYSAASSTSLGSLLATGILKKEDMMIDGKTPSNCIFNSAGVPMHDDCFTTVNFDTDVSISNGQYYFFIQRSIGGNNGQAFLYMHGNVSIAHRNAFPENRRVNSLTGSSTSVDINDLAWVKLYFDECVSSGTCISITRDIVSTTTWNATSTPYLVSGNIQIDPNVILNIGLGVVIKFDTATASSLAVNGTLNASGTPEVGQIVMTSLHDDYWGDTNQNGNSTTPSAGDWGGIIIQSGGKANLENVVVRYAGATTTNSSQIYNNGGLLNLDSGRILYGTTYGVKNVSGTTSIEDSELAYNDTGFYLSGGSAGAIDSNVFHDNTSYGVYNDTTNVINTENNSWGYDSGPYHSTSSPFGEGDRVSDYVDYDPWTQDLHYLLGDDSVDNNEIRWTGSTQYSDEWDDAVVTWNNLGSINIAPDDASTTADLEVVDVNDGDLVWVGLYDTVILGPDELYLNQYYLEQNTDDEIQHTITHELGHALGLNHSYTGNIMYYRQLEQTSLGIQDEYDYNYLWQ